MLLEDNNLKGGVIPHPFYLFGQNALFDIGKNLCYNRNREKGG